MRKLAIWALASLICAVYPVGCKSINQAPPPVTAEMTKVASSVQLHKGRNLFVSRCIECHTLPPVWHYTAKDWPRLVDSMAHRAHLKPEEREAIVAYVLVARKE